MWAREELVWLFDWLGLKKEHQATSCKICVCYLDQCVLCFAKNKCLWKWKLRSSVFFRSGVCIWCLSVGFRKIWCVSSCKKQLRLELSKNTFQCQQVLLPAILLQINIYSLDFYALETFSIFTRSHLNYICFIKRILLQTFNTFDYTINKSSLTLKALIWSQTRNFYWSPVFFRVGSKLVPS